MHRALCKGCGTPIIWATSPAGKKIPLEVVKNVYYIDDQDQAHPVPEVMEDGMRSPELYISHFVTCPVRDRFRRS